MDEMAVPEKLREEVVKFFPSARRALLKSGGNFPYLSRADEFNMYVEVHLKSQKYKLDEEKAPASFPPESAAQAPAAAPAPARFATFTMLWHTRSDDLPQYANPPV
jgi:hypothetical protein